MKFRQTKMAVQKCCSFSFKCLISETAHGSMVRQQAPVHIADKYHWCCCILWI